MLQDAYSQAVRQSQPHWSKKKKEKKGFQKSSTTRANGFLPFQETLSHPLLMTVIEDPKMELKTFLLPLRLGLLTAFQSAEVNIFTMRALPPLVSFHYRPSFFLNDHRICEKDYLFGRRLWIWLCPWSKVKPMFALWEPWMANGEHKSNHALSRVHACRKPKRTPSAVKHLLLWEEVFKVINQWGQSISSQKCKAAQWNYLWKGQ